MRLLNCALAAALGLFLAASQTPAAHAASISIFGPTELDFAIDPGEIDEITLTLAVDFDLSLTSYSLNGPAFDTANLSVFDEGTATEIFTLPLLVGASLSGPLGTLSAGEYTFSFFDPDSIISGALSLALDPSTPLPQPVPLPPAAMLFLSALGLVAGVRHFARSKKS